MGVGVNEDAMSTLIFRRALCYGISALILKGKYVKAPTHSATSWTYFGTVYLIEDLVCCSVVAQNG